MKFLECSFLVVTDCGHTGHEPVATVIDGASNDPGMTPEKLGQSLARDIENGETGHTVKVYLLRVSRITEPSLKLVYPVVN